MSTDERDADRYERERKEANEAAELERMKSREADDVRRQDERDRYEEEEGREA